MTDRQRYILNQLRNEINGISTFSLSIRSNESYYPEASVRRDIQTLRSLGHNIVNDQTRMGNVYRLTAAR